MIQGLDRFRDHFDGLESSYFLIGGVATQLVLDDAGLGSRTTKDLDVVLCAEALDDAFVQRFWTLVAEARYAVRQAGSSPRRYFRFMKPSTDDYPVMIELFSRRLDPIAVPAHAHLTPVPTGEDLSSLSAILIDDDLYPWLLDGRTTLDGVPIVGTDHLIALKLRAYLDLSKRRDAGDPVHSKDIKKHRSDVLRLLQVVVPESRDDVPHAVREDAARFLARVRAESPDVRALRLAFGDLSQALDVLRVRFDARG